MTLKEQIMKLQAYKMYEGEDTVYVERDDVLKAIEQEQKTAHWKKGDYWTDGCGMGESYGYYYECSNCGETVKDDYLKCSYSYCPNCGARMVEPHESEDK